MPEFEPERLARWTGGSWSEKPPGRISGFSYDSRILLPGHCFVALKTEQRDGHDYLKDAQSAGASMALVSRRVTGVTLPQLVVEDSLRAFQSIATEYRKTLSLPLIGVTGSCGKTSTKDLLEVLLGKERTLATRGNLNNALGLPYTILQVDPEIHELAVIEAGINRIGEMDLLRNILQPDVALVTMVGPAHLEYMKSVENVAREKAMLLGMERSRGKNYFPSSCLRWMPFKDLIRESVVIRSTDSRGKIEGAIRVYEYALDMEPGGGRSLAVRTQDGPVLLFPVPHVSPGQAQNTALAVAVALDMAIPPDIIRDRFTQWRPSKNRGEKLKYRNQYFYADCYNANPASVEDALDAFLEGFDPGLKRLYVIGSMDELGPGAGEFHREVGARLFLRPGDVAYLIGEFAEDILEGLKRNDPPPGSYQVFRETREARAGVERFSGAILLKGSRSYQLEQLLPEDPESLSLKGGMAC